MALLGLCPLVHGQDDKYLPQSSHGVDQVFNHAHYYVAYSNKHRQAIWVAYELSVTELVKAVPRTNRFFACKYAGVASASLADYSGSGYDRGHLAPAADMSFSYASMSESFCLCNMSPQVPGFNRGIWKKLETAVRGWAAAKGGLYVATGPILKEKPKGAIGPNSVTVPARYYKVLYAEQDHKMIAFVLKNASSKRPLMDAAVTIDELERITDLDFFSQLPDETEAVLESTIDKAYWHMSVNKPTYSAPSYPSSLAQQCKGITKSSGKRCRNKTKSPSGYCHHHAR